MKFRINDLNVLTPVEPDRAVVFERLGTYALIRPEGYSGKQKEELTYSSLWIENGAGYFHPIQSTGFPKGISLEDLYEVSDLIEVIWEGQRS